MPADLVVAGHGGSVLLQTHALYQGVFAEFPLDGQRRLLDSAFPLQPRLFGKAEMHSVKLITVHFWVSTVGIVLYIASMWIAGVMQGLMWRQVNVDGTLAYSFVESVKVSYPFWGIRLMGGVLFLSGMLIMAYNMFKTMAGGKTEDAPVLSVSGQHA